MQLIIIIIIIINMFCSKASLHGYSSVGNEQGDSKGKVDNVGVRVSVL
jgi:hypothetical protein